MKIVLIFLFMNLSVHAVSRFDFVLKEIIKFQEFRQEFHENYKEKLKESKTALLQLDNDDKATLIKRIDITIQTGDEFINNLYEKAQDISSNPVKAVKLLEFLLFERFKLIFQTTQNAESLSSSAVVIPVQDYSLCEKHYKNKNKCEFYKYVKKNNIALYQFQVLLIKKIFDSLRIEELSEAAVILLRSAPQLTDLLSNKTQELGFLDNCGGYLKCMIYSNDFKCHHSKAVTAIRNDLKSKTWENNKKLYDIYWYDAHFVVKERIEPFKGLGVPKGHGIKYYSTDYQEGLNTDDLPFPDYLKQVDRPFIENESFFATVNFQNFTDEIIILQDKQINLEENNENDDLKDNCTSNKEDFLYPAGVRKFHNLIPDSNYEKLNLNNKRQEIINKIFDPKASTKISYKEFKNLWISLGGTIIENRKTSHKQLRGPHKEPLFGIYAHGDSQTYGKNTIKYFRAALYYIGARASI